MHRIIVVLMLLIPCAVFAAEQEKKGGGRPPANVVVAKARDGKAAPQGEFIGSIRFPEVSDVAAEVQGRVDTVQFDAGDAVTGGNILVRLDSDLLGKRLEAARAEHEQALADLENARLESERMSKLIASRSVSRKEYDEARLSEQALGKKAIAMKAEAERLRLEIAKSAIRAPFDGVVLERHASRGEWVSAGTPVATVARNDYVEVQVEVPQHVLPYVRTGIDVPVAVGGKRLAGKVTAVIPEGDEVTRTFPVKVRLDSVDGLAQGMEARVSFPTGAEISAVLVPRDAVITQFRQNVVWVVREGKAMSVPVIVEAWMGHDAAVKGQGITAGALVVSKGNERLRPGQPVAHPPLDTADAVD